MSTASLGAGGHLNGAADTPTMALPLVKPGRMSRSFAAPASD
jgi:hypothetical protein